MPHYLLIAQRLHQRLKTCRFLVLPVEGSQSWEHVAGRALHDLEVGQRDLLGMGGEQYQCEPGVQLAPPLHSCEDAACRAPVSRAGAGDDHAGGEEQVADGTGSFGADRDRGRWRLAYSRRHSATTYRSDASDFGDYSETISG